MLRKKLLGLCMVAPLMVGLVACKGTSNDTAKKKATGPSSMAAEKGHLGKAFEIKAETDLDTLIKNPKKFDGKTVRVSGVVTAHCHHRRAWFALRSKAGSPLVLRVQTKPAFLVPKDVKHNQTHAVAEGVVSLKTVPEKYAKHMAKEHGLFGGVPDQVTGPQVVAQVKASGATFN